MVELFFIFQNHTHSQCLKTTNPDPWETHTSQIKPSVPFVKACDALQRACCQQCIHLLQIYSSAWWAPVLARRQDLFFTVPSTLRIWTSFPKKKKERKEKQNLPFRLRN